MVARTSNNDPKLYVTIEKSSKDKLLNKDFQYPLLFTYHVCTTDPTTNQQILVYERRISIQMGGLENGLQIHLLKLDKTRDCYRLSADAIDKNEIKYTSIASITLSPIGLLKENNPRHLSTIILKINN